MKKSFTIFKRPGMQNVSEDSLGLNLETMNGRMFVTAVLPGFPAFRSGQV
jgi:hypothetical protein